MKRCIFLLLSVFLLSSCNQIAKKIAKEGGEKAAKALMKEGTERVGMKASRKLSEEEMKKLGKEAILHNSGTRKVAMKDALGISVKETSRYVSKIGTRIMIRSKNQFLTKKQYIKWLSENGGGKIVKTGIKDGSILRKNMLTTMGANGKYARNTLKNGNMAHHVIGNKTPKAASKLKLFGIDINDPMNGVFLPSNNRSGLRGTIHRGGHTQDYYDYVEQIFSNCKSKDDCYNVLDLIKGDFYKGKIKLYTNAKHQVNRTFKTAA